MVQKGCVCGQGWRGGERMKERKKMWQDIKTYESEWRDTQWRSSLCYSCNFWANLKLYQNKITRTKDSCLECWGRSVLPSDACEQGDPSVLQPQGRSAIGQSRLCGWKDGKTDRTRALTGILSCRTHHPWNLCLRMVCFSLPRTHEGSWGWGLIHN